MKILVVHPTMSLFGGGERLCCESMRALLSMGHEITILSESFNPQRIEDFFGYGSLFDRVNLSLYPPSHKNVLLGTPSSLIHHLQGQKREIRKLKGLRGRSFDLIFSTQDAGYIPDLNLPVIQWGYFPRYFPNFDSSRFANAIFSMPLRFHYERKISRVGLVLAISLYSKWHLDRQWKRPSVLLYPSCNMVAPATKRNLVVTAGRAIPAKRLDLFWRIAQLRPNYDFVMLLTQDPTLVQYSVNLSKQSPSNGRTIFNPPREAYHKFLAEARVYLHLMEGEHFGITTVEAMSASCVPVVHDSGGSREIVSEGVGFRWKSIDEVPFMIDEAMEMSPSSIASHRAQEFNFEKFEGKLSSIFSELHG